MNSAVYLIAGGLVGAAFSGAISAAIDPKPVVAQVSSIPAPSSGFAPAANCYAFNDLTQTWDRLRNPQWFMPPTRVNGK